jgi:hypothetical protein
MLEPNVAPLITLLNRLKKRVPVKSPRWEWFEDDYQPRWVTAGAGNALGDTAILLAAGEGAKLIPGDLFIVPKVLTSSVAPELVRVISVAGDTATCVRAQGGTTAAAIVASQALRIVGNAFEEGAALPTSKTVNPVKKITYTQIFRTTVEFSKTAVATQVYGAPGGDRQREHKKKLAEHKQLLNSALLFGSASESMAGGPSGKPIRTTQGLIAEIKTNITDATGTLTKKLFEAYSRQAFRYGSSTKMLLAAPTIKSAINEWAREFLLVKPGEEKYGVKINTIETAHGTWLLVNDWMLESQGTYGYGATALSIDLDQLRYIYLSNNGENRDTRIEEDKLQDGSDKVVDEILTEGGFAIMQEKYHARLFNVTDYA